MRLTLISEVARYRPVHVRQNLCDFSSERPVITYIFSSFVLFLVLLPANFLSRTKQKKKHNQVRPVASKDRNLDAFGNIIKR